MNYAYLVILAIFLATLAPLLLVLAEREAAKRRQRRANLWWYSWLFMWCAIGFYNLIKTNSYKKFLENRK